VGRNPDRPGARATISEAQKRLKEYKCLTAALEIKIKVCKKGQRSEARKDGQKRR